MDHVYNPNIWLMLCYFTCLPQFQAYFPRQSERVLLQRFPVSAFDHPNILYWLYQSGGPRSAGTLVLPGYSHFTRMENSMPQCLLRRSQRVAKLASADACRLRPFSGQAPFTSHAYPRLDNRWTGAFLLTTRRSPAPPLPRHTHRQRLLWRLCR